VGHPISIMRKDTSFILPSFIYRCPWSNCSLIFTFLYHNKISKINNWPHLIVSQHALSSVQDLINLIQFLPCMKVRPGWRPKSQLKCIVFHFDVHFPNLCQFPNSCHNHATCTSKPACHFQTGNFTWKSNKLKLYFLTPL
jgi:hypothetical protein